MIWVMINYLQLINHVINSMRAWLTVYGKVKNHVTNN